MLMCDHPITRCQRETLTAHLLFRQVSTEQQEKAQQVAKLQERLNAAQKSEATLEGRVKELEQTIAEKTLEVEQAVQDKGGVAPEELVAVRSMYRAFGFASS